MYDFQEIKYFCYFRICIFAYRGKVLNIAVQVLEEYYEIWIGDFWEKILV